MGESEDEVDSKSKYVSWSQLKLIDISGGGGGGGHNATPVPSKKPYIVDLKTFRMLFWGLALLIGALYLARIRRVYIKTARDHYHPFATIESLSGFHTKGPLETLVTISLTGALFYSISLVVSICRQYG